VCRVIFPYEQNCMKMMPKCLKFMVFIVLFAIKRANMLTAKVKYINEAMRLKSHLELALFEVAKSF